MRDKSLFLQKRRISKHLIWKKVKLGDIVFIQKGQQLNRSTLKESGEYYVQNGGVDPSGYTDKWNTKENTITISEGGNSCGFVKLNKQKFWSGGHCYTLINIDDKIERNFLYYYLKNNEQKIMRLRVGSGIPNIQKKEIKKLIVSVPPLSEQKKIMELLSTCDQVIEKLNKLILFKEKQFKWLLKKLISDQKNNPSWEKVKLGDIVFIQKGQQLNRSTLQKSGKYYVQNGGVDSSGYTDKWNIKENTITISEGGNSCGFVKLNKQKFWSGGHCYTLINIDDKIERNFLYYYLKNNEQKIMRLRVGSGIPNIQKKDIEGFLIIYPDLKIQKEISDVLKYKEKEMETLQQLSEKYEEQKKGLMQQLLIEKKRL